MRRRDDLEPSAAKAPPPQAPSPVPPAAFTATDGREQVVLVLAAEILEYLRAHPLQADTDAHIARWWLLQCRVERALGQVRAALDHLEASGAIEQGPAGLYRLPAPTAGDPTGPERA